MASAVRARRRQGKEAALAGGSRKKRVYWKANLMIYDYMFFKRQ